MRSKKERRVRKKTGVLIHGCHLQTITDWDKIVWGDPPSLLGRLPKGVKVALEEKAELIVVGTGSSEACGKKEAEFTRDYLLHCFPKLNSFSDFQEINLEKAYRRIEKIIVAETRSQNTHQELFRAGWLFKEAGVTRIILVSSPVHIPRCLRDAYTVFSGDEHLKHLTNDLLATPSDTGWARAEGTVIIEPPHRPDRSDTLYRLIKGITELPEDSQIRLLGELHREQFFKK